MKKRSLRVFSVLLAAVLLCGAGGSLLRVLTPNVRGAEIDDDVPKTAEPEPSPEPVATQTTVPDCFKVRIGLMYGTAVTVGFEVKAPAGFLIGSQTVSGKAYSFRSLWSVSDTLVAAVCDGNLSNKNRTYSFSSVADTTVGGYHVALQQEFSSEEALRTEIERVNAALSGSGLYAFPAYENGALKLYIGAFAEAKDAGEAVRRLYVDPDNPDRPPVFEGASFVTKEPTKKDVALVDPLTDRILFEFHCEDGTEALGVYPLRDGTDDVYLKTPASNLYKGVFAFGRYETSSVRGVSVTNVLPLEDYVMGVLPYEVSSSWNAETLKAFAIVVRTYTLTNLKRHDKSYGFDLCNTSNCQVYKGAKSVTESVRRAVLDTSSLTVEYDGKLAEVYYASSFGGVSVKASDVWGGTDLPYLVAQLTPWEKYWDYPKSFWTKEVSGAELCQYLKKQGGNFASLSGAITSITVDEYCEDSTYIKTITFRDTAGFEATLTGPSRIRTTLTDYLYSANFVVGKGSVRYTERTVWLPGTTPTYVPDGTMLTSPADIGAIRVLTGVSQSLESLLGATVLTAAGAEFLFSPAESVIREQNASDVLYQEATASSPDSFIFVGKGWGHGVGMSQYGAKDLGDGGMLAEAIVKTYFPGTVVKNYDPSAGTDVPPESGGPSESENLAEDPAAVTQPVT